MVSNKITSEAEEMYLVSIARLVENGQASPVPLSQLAESLSIQPASANQMVRQLEEAGWVTYTPYVGVALTEAGHNRSQRILRSHRLWEVFLVEHLGVLPVNADALACRIEHILPEETVERLAQFLGQPSICPDGKPIPPPETTVLPKNTLPLGDLQVQQSGIVMQIKAEGAIRAFLKSEGVLPGTEVTVLAIGAQGNRLVRLPGEKCIHLVLPIVQSILVEPTSPDFLK